MSLPTHDSLSNPIPSSPVSSVGGPDFQVEDDTVRMTAAELPASVVTKKAATANPKAETPSPMMPPPSRAAEAPVRALRVIHVVNGEHFSGAERVQSHLGRCLPEFGIRADFVCVKPGRFAEMLEQRQGEVAGESWGECFRVPMRGRLDWTAVGRLTAVVRREKANLLHAHTPRTALLASQVARRTGVPWVYHVHSPAARDSARPVLNRVNTWIERYSLGSVDHQITVSNSLREDLIGRGGDPDRVTVVHNGVPADRPQRQTKPYVGGSWTIGMVALMRPRKGLEVLLDALAESQRRGHDVTLRCIGPFETENYRAKIEAQVERLKIGKRIQWVGFTNDIPAELARLDAMALPSLYGEGLPMVVLEAMAAAVPVIATRVEGTPEAIRHGREGLLAEPNDPASLAEAIESLVTGQYDWDSLAEAAARRHETAFSDWTMARATAEVYRRVLQGRPIDNR